MYASTPVGLGAFLCVLNGVPVQCSFKQGYLVVFGQSEDVRERAGARDDDAISHI